MDDWNASNQDIFITKLDSSGAVQWTRILATTANDEGGSLLTVGLGNVYFTGATLGALGGPLVGSFDIVAGKYDAAGNLLWLKQFGTAGEEHRSAGISGDNLGNIYIGGRTTGSWGAPNAGGPTPF